MYRSSFSFETTPIAKEIKVTCNGVTHTARYPYTDENALTFTIPAYDDGTYSRLDRVFAVSMTWYEDPPEWNPELTGSYTFMIRQYMPGVESGAKIYHGDDEGGDEGGSVSASVWENSDIIVEMKGFFPFNCENPPSYNGPDRLYLYGWTSSEYYDINDNSKPLTIYTKSSTPEVGDETYDSKGFLYDGLAWDGADIGKINTTIIGSKTSNTITIGSAQNIK